MEDNNAINEQPNAVNEKVTYEELVEANNQLNNQLVEVSSAANHWYQIAEQLKDTWKLQRANFLFEIVKSDYFDKELKDKAVNELTTFLFPIKEDKTE